jgi:NADH dehydrogenase FAD-containing subunit
MNSIFGTMQLEPWNPRILESFFKEKIAEEPRKYILAVKKIMENTKTGKHLVLVGGGHSHIETLVNLNEFTRRGHSVTLISPSPHHYYSGMGPGMLSGIYRPREVRFNVRKMAEDRDAAYLEDVVEGIDPSRHSLSLRSGRKIHYDIVSFNTGSEIETGGFVPSRDSVFPVKPINNLLKARKRILHWSPDRREHIVVAGGGPAGVEISANAWKIISDHRINAGITLITGSRIMEQFPQRVRHLCSNSLRRKGIRIIEGTPLKALAEGSALLGDGQRLPFSIAFLATGVRPAPIFRGSGLAISEDGSLLVNAHLQSVSHPEVFGGGDCIQIKGDPLPKVGVHAVKEGMLLRGNLLSALEGGRLATYMPQRHYMLIFNMGDGRGILWRNGLAVEGRLAFALKNYIDKGFIKKFQVSGELTEDDDVEEMSEDEHH